jgi:hypothetical protein
MKLIVDTPLNADDTNRKLAELLARHGPLLSADATPIRHLVHTVREGLRRSALLGKAYCQNKSHPSLRLLFYFMEFFKETSRNKGSDKAHKI